MATICNDTIIRGKRVIPFRSKISFCDDELFFADEKRRKTDADMFFDNSRVTPEPLEDCGPLFSRLFEENPINLHDFEHYKFMSEFSEPSLYEMPSEIKPEKPEASKLELFIRADEDSPYISFVMPDEINSLCEAIRGSFKIPDANKKVVLRNVHTSCVTPISPHMPPGHYTLLACKKQNQIVLPCAEKTSRYFSIDWIQKPPYGEAHWLSAHVTKANQVRPLKHLISPTVTIGIRSSKSRDVQRNLLQKVNIKLFSASFEDVTKYLHQGDSTVYWDESTQMMVVQFPDLAISEISRNHFLARECVSSVQQEASGVHKRGACGWYHIKVELNDGNECSELWLRDEKDDYAKLVVKHKRCAQTGGWAERHVGPYADHSRCTPSHIDEHGRMLCRGCGIEHRN